MIKKLGWYKRRLSCMSTAEICYRFYSLVIKKIIRKYYPPVYSAPLQTDSRIKPWLTVPVNLQNSEPCLEWANEVISGKFHLLGTQLCQAGVKPDWNQDPRGDQADSKDIKYVWELNRHLHWTALAQAYCCTREEKYLTVLLQQIDSWLEQCPVDSLPNWQSGLEMAIRLINWSAIYVLLEIEHGLLFLGQAGEYRKEHFLKAVYQQTQAIQDDYSRYSSANNHLIGEAAGVYVAAKTWALWPQMATWGQKARQILITEIEKQVTSDGVVREQAFSYQLFLLEFFFIVSQVAEVSHDEPLPDLYRQRLEAMLNFLAMISSESGKIPMVGDADDGAVLKLTGFNHELLPTLFALGALKFNRPDFKAKLTEMPGALTWWLRSQEKEALEKIPSCPVEQKNYFPEGGYVVFKDNSDKEILMLADVGELGYLSIAAHGHADALSIWLSVAGKDFLVDAGTYSYHRSEKWRNYFRSTVAHNTITIDGLSQSEIGGSFLWLDKAQTTIEYYEHTAEKTHLIASHNGYQRLKKPVLHRREIIFYRNKHCFMLTDTIETIGEHTIEQRWQFAPECKLRLIDNGVKIINQEVLIRFNWLNRIGQIQILTGEMETTIGGWVSNIYDQKELAPQLVYQIKGRDRIIINCEILCNESN